MNVTGLIHSVFNLPALISAIAFLRSKVTVPLLGGLGIRPRGPPRFLPSFPTVPPIMSGVATATSKSNHPPWIWPPIHQNLQNPHRLPRPPLPSPPFGKNKDLYFFSGTVRQDHRPPSNLLIRMLGIDIQPHSQLHRLVKFGRSYLLDELRASLGS